MKRIFDNNRDFYIIIFLVIASFILSLYFNSFNYDGHHAARMFVEANELLMGLKPYEDIFITYGILTTILHSLSLVLFGNQIMSVFIITSIFYALSFLIYYCILKNLNINKNLSVVSTLLIFFIHPTIVLPWSNYLAYFFLLMGLFFLTKKESNSKYFIYAGFFWSLSILCRQTYILPFLLTIIILFTSYYFFKFNFFNFQNKIDYEEKKFFIFKNISYLLFFFTIIILLFLFYLYFAGVLEYLKYNTFT